MRLSLAQSADAAHLHLATLPPAEPKTGIAPMLLGPGRHLIQHPGTPDMEVPKAQLRKAVMSSLTRTHSNLL